MEQADSEKKKIDAVKAKELTGLTASRQIISTPGIFKYGNGNNKIINSGSETPKRTPLRLGL